MNKKEGFVKITEDENEYGISFGGDIIDGIFLGSSNFDGENILEFIKALCKVSKDELFEQYSTPRNFSLKRIVEVADLNMHRIKFEWIRIWNVIRDHFSEVGCKGNKDIVMDVVDLLK